MPKSQNNGAICFLALPSPGRPGRRLTSAPRLLPPPNPRRFVSARLGPLKGAQAVGGRAGWRGSSRCGRRRGEGFPAAHGEGVGVGGGAGGGRAGGDVGAAVRLAARRECVCVLWVTIDRGVCIASVQKYKSSSLGGAGVCMHGISETPGALGQIKGIRIYTSVFRRTRAALLLQLRTGRQNYPPPTTNERVHTRARLPRRRAE